MPGQRQVSDRELLDAAVTPPASPRADAPEFDRAMGAKFPDVAKSPKYRSRTYYDGTVWTKPQLQKLSVQLGTTYDVTRQGVTRLGGRVADDKDTRAALNGDLVSALDEESPAPSSRSGAPARGAGPGPLARSATAPRSVSDDELLAALGGGEPDSRPAPSPAAPVDRRSWLSRAYDAAFTAPKFVTDAAARLANAIDDPNNSLTVQKEGMPIRVPPSGMAAGMVQGAANLLTPGDVALTVLGAEPVANVARSVRGGERAIRAVQQVANVATAARGVERVANAESIGDAAAGVAQVAMGGAGALAHRTAAPPTAGPAGDRLALPPGATFTVAEDGSIVPLGTELPAPQSRPDPSGSGRSVPAAVMGYDAQGGPIYSSDPNAVSVGPRPTRGLLAAGPRFHAGESGHVSDIQLLDAIQPVAATANRGAIPEPSTMRVVPAPIMARRVEVDPRLNQVVYSSDAAASSVPLVSHELQPEVRRMREEVNSFRYEPGRLIDTPGVEVNRPNYPGGARYVDATQGSPVMADVAAELGYAPKRDAVLSTLDALAAGQEPDTKIARALVRVAQGRQNGEAGYGKPLIPIDETPARARGAGPLGAGGVAPSTGEGAASPLDDFEAFSRMFDDIAPGNGEREPGEAGFATPRALASVAGGLAGGAYGAATGDDTEDRLKRGALFGIAGAAAPLLLGGRGASVIDGLASRAAEGESFNAPKFKASRSGEPMRDPLAGVDPFVAKFSNPVVREGVARLIADNAGYAEQRRGVIDTDALGKFATEVKVNAAKALPKGTALNADQITAYARALQQTQERVAKLAAVVTSGKSTDSDLLALQAAKAEADVIGKSLMGARSEAGRALASLNFYRGVLDTGSVDLIRDTLSGPGMRDEAEKIAKGFAALPADPIARFKWLQQQGSSTLWDKARSVYYANILSGVKTHERNLIGNVANTAFDLIAHPFGVAADAARSAMTGQPRTMYLAELPAQTVGTLAGMQRGFSDALFTLRHGSSPEALSRALSKAEAGKLDIPRVEFKGGVANPFNLPGRALDASDAFFRTAARERERYGLAYAQARREGLRDEAFGRRVVELQSGNSADALKLKEQAANYARRAVFQEKPGAVASWIARGNELPGLKYVMPFVLPFTKTPANIMRQGFEYSPAGLLMKAARQDGRSGAQAQGRAIAGTLGAGYLAYLAATGQLSGDGPTDQGERAALMERGWRPNSLKVGDKWISTQLFQPVSVQASVIANAFDAWRAGGGKPSEAPDVIVKAIGRSANSFLDQSFLSGLFNFAEAIKDPERSAVRFAGQAAASAVPLSAATRTVQQAIDPVVRQPKTITQTVKAGIPGLSEQVPPRLDRWGEPVLREGGAARRALDPFNASDETDDPTARELDRLGVDVPSLSDKVKLPGNRTLSPSESLEVRQRQGRAMRQAVERVMSAGNFSRFPDGMKADALKRAIDRAREAVNRDVRDEVLRGRISRPAERSNDAGRDGGR